MRDTERQRHRQREKQIPCEEPDVGLDLRTPGSCPRLMVALNSWATRAAQEINNLKKNNRAYLSNLPPIPPVNRELTNWWFFSPHSPKISVLTKLLNSRILKAFGNRRKFIISAGWVSEEEGTCRNRYPIGVMLPIFAVVNRPVKRSKK